MKRKSHFDERDYPRLGEFLESYPDVAFTVALKLPYASLGKKNTDPWLNAKQ